ncbi:MAG TPA: hypothetical protein VFT99_11755, partial [Roseiflexaceae bacterium]|nr:hypothetical protein [Roseiflexaceae bacterium]
MTKQTTRAGWIAAGLREPVLLHVDGEAVLGVLHLPRNANGPVPAVRSFMALSARKTNRTRSSSKCR